MPNKNENKESYIQGHINRNITVFKDKVYDTMKIYSEDFSYEVKFYHDEFQKFFNKVDEFVKKSTKPTFTYTYQEPTNKGAYKSSLKEEKPHIIFLLNKDEQNEKFLNLQILIGVNGIFIKSRQDVMKVLFLKLGWDLINSYIVTLQNDESTQEAKDNKKFESKFESVCGY